MARVRGDGHVPLLSRLEILEIKTHVFDKANGSTTRIFSRDCLEVTLALPGKRRLHVLINHFKSKLGGNASDAKRKAQADRVVEILGGFNLSTDLVIVAGDLNDTPDRPPLQSLLGLAGLTDVLAPGFPDPKDRWTYRDKKQIDYMLVSKPLAAAMTDAGVERRGLLNASKLTGGVVTSFPTITDDTNDASDHCAVWAEFSI